MAKHGGHVTALFLCAQGEPCFLRTCPPDHSVTAIATFVPRRNLQGASFDYDFKGRGELLWPWKLGAMPNRLVGEMNCQQ
jgi:hypothetical protein